MEEKYICHNCGRELADQEEFMPYETVEKKYIKCKACYEKDPVLRNFQKTEIYSRVVGYIRPVEQWNAGKKMEYGDRKEFVLSDPACC
jgi:anaerobic ribonucleoside-triphosphate reductase